MKSCPVDSEAESAILWNLYRSFIGSDVRNVGRGIVKFTLGHKQKAIHMGGNVFDKVT